MYLKKYVEFEEKYFYDRGCNYRVGYVLNKDSKKFYSFISPNNIYIFSDSLYFRELIFILDIYKITIKFNNKHLFRL